MSAITTKRIRDGVVTSERITEMEVSIEEMSLDEKFAWIRETYPDSNLALTGARDGGWTFLVEHADGKWTHTLGMTVNETVEKMIVRLKEST